MVFYTRNDICKVGYEKTVLPLKQCPYIVGAFLRINRSVSSAKHLTGYLQISWNFVWNVSCKERIFTLSFCILPYTAFASFVNNKRFRISVLNLLSAN